MEYLSETRLEKYEDILREIDETNKECELLQKAISKVDNKILTAKVALYHSTIKRKVFQVRVKLFSSVFKVYDIYGEESIKYCKDFITQKNTKFYVVEVYVSKLLQEKITKQSWILNTTVRNFKQCVSQCLPLKKSFDNPLRVIVPFSDSLETAEVHTKILLPSENYWTTINLETVTVDISYHFESNVSWPVTENLDKKIWNLLEIHGKKISKLRLPKNRKQTYNLVFKCNNSSLVTSILKNCYHNLDIEVLNALKQENETFSFELTTGNTEKSIIKFDRNNNTLSMEANFEVLWKLKKYFLMNLHSEELKINKNVYSQLMNIIFYIQSELGGNTANSSDVIIIYEELRKLWFQLFL